MFMKNLFNDNWEFTKQELECDIENIKNDDSQWKCIDVPHDWLIYDTVFFHQSCEGWYRKRFIIDSEDCSEEKKRSFIRFEGVYMDSTIYINGNRIGEWKYGYSTFEFDITNALRNGVNEIYVRVVMQMPNSRWYTGAGIYRNVWLKTKSYLSFTSDGIYISTEKAEGHWKVKINTELSYHGEQVTFEELRNRLQKLGGKEDIIIRHSIFDNNGILITCSESSSNSHLIEVTSPKLWNIDDPNLYILKSELILEGATLDEECNRFGFRTIDFDSNKGLFLNERPIKIHGVCQHHDLGALGAAVNPVALRRQVTILREMGVNAIRTSHNMCAVELLELADEMGILINNEAFDMWEKPKNLYDYARFFPDWVERDIACWIRRDRNHPCIIMWSIGNEIYDTHAGERGQEITRYLMDLVHQHDTYHNAPVTIGSNYMPWVNAQKCADIVKLAGYNYAEKYYEAHHRKYKDWMIYGSETGSVVQSRGIYHFPIDKEILCDDDEQCSSLGNSITSWGARSIERCIIDDRDAEYCAGMFLWTGFDYIGEPTPYHTKNCYFGQVDTAGFKKDSFYLYQAEWTDYRISPMIHLYPYWDFNEGQLIDVCVCSNAPKVELLLNQKSQGVFRIDHQYGQELLAKWKLPYVKGELHAVAYDEYDHIIAEGYMRSFRDAAKIRLIPDKRQLKADGQDLIFIEITMEDMDGNPVYNANNRVNIKVSGAGRLIGLDNGNSTDYESYKGTSRRLFSGKLLAIVAAKTVAGEIQLQVTSPGMSAAILTLEAESCEVVKGLSCLEENAESTYSNEIPIRKLEIISLMGTQLNQVLREVTVEVKIYPENATYDDIQWRVTNANGVDSNIVSMAAKGRNATLKALGDGTFYVRATTNNGGSKVDLISMLEFGISGMGTAYYNPYEFISGSLYSKSFGGVGSGNERGVATPRDGESFVVYDRLDFGEIGSDRITLPIFELGSLPTKIEIWEGVPYEEGSELLADVIYHKPSKWNIYQEETYQLQKRLVGITSIAFLLRGKVHIKGFTFEKRLKAYEKLPVLTYSKLYGDSYTITDECIKSIGNNVTIVFEDMDFKKGVQKLIICGRSVIDKNTIHVNFNGTNGEVVQLAEFLYSEEFVEREFRLEQVEGNYTVSFVYLPGSDFDFKWFRFEC